MKKIFVLLLFMGLAVSGMQLISYAQQDTLGGNNDTAAAQAPVADDNAAEADEAGAEGAAPAAAQQTKVSGHQLLKKYFIEGGVPFMTPILIILILGLALAIERIITLNLATVNTKKILANIENELSSGNVEKAKEICKSTRGPVASIFLPGIIPGFRRH
ncbi:MAG: hypothetical protein KatS3mg031_2226 [Chitinophagales bacterium]|nr:MAG: hypothetical protein KatS3mg031_2226 [Chitinophagales bacterium]